MSDKINSPVTIDQLRVFVTVIDAGSFSRAAVQLRRVQSAVSYSIANLERLLDVQLFDRRGRVAVPTAAATTLVTDARRILDEVDRLALRARAVAQAQS